MSCSGGSSNVIILVAFRKNVLVWCVLILLSEVYYEILPKSENLLPLHNAYRNLNAFLKTIYIFFQNDMISELLYLPWWIFLNRFWCCRVVQYSLTQSSKEKIQYYWNCAVLLQTMHIGKLLLPNMKFVSLDLIQNTNTKAVPILANKMLLWCFW